MGDTFTEMCVKKTDYCIVTPEDKPVNISILGEAQYANPAQMGNYWVYGLRIYNESEVTLNF